MAVQISVPYMVPTLSTYFQVAKGPRAKWRLGPLLCQVGSDLSDHFQRCGQTVAKLERDGWRLNGYCNACEAQHQDVRTEEQAVTRLRAAGIDPATVIVFMHWDDWFAVA